MSSRSGSNSLRRHSRESLDDFASLPVPRLPPLRALSAQRDRDRDRDSASLTLATANRPQSRHWTAASRRAERIRNIENRAPSFDDFERPMDEGWPSMSRRADRMRTAAEGSRPTNFEDLDRSLEEANSHLRALLDLQNNSQIYTPPPPLNFSPSPSLRPQDLPDSNRRHKRRKLDSVRLTPSSKGFRYGKYGQVEPGQLQMEIVSCDGGMFSNKMSFAADNILKNDNSVYCTKGNRCNIVLRHQGSTVFTLRELVIKAPASMNYSHPVREGMVFISMDQDDALSRTAQYQIQYTPHKNADDDDDSSAEAEAQLFHHLTSHDIIFPEGGDGGPITRTRPAHFYRNTIHSDDSDDLESRMPQMPPEFAANLPEFQVTTECSDDEDEADGGPRLSRRAPNRIGSLPFEAPDSDSDDGMTQPFGSEYLYDSHHPAHWHLYNNPAARRRSRDRERARERERERERDRDFDLERSGHSSTHALTEAWEAHASATQDAVRAVGGQLLVPHARFFIEKRKSKCTIRFEPPVSGRFILLKMWSSHHDPSGNIDIQSVMARGFAGPRYFPSVELR